MYGAIIGDIIGSRFEFSKPTGFNAYTVRLFENDCFYTDDTVMSVATKYAILNNVSYAKAYKQFGRSYPNVGYGSKFKEWLVGDSEAAYHSFGNGSAMRVGFVGEYFTTPQEVAHQARLSAECTHNHPQGIRGAQATARAIFLAKRGVPKDRLMEAIEREYGYKLNRPLKVLRIFSGFDVTCEGSVPLALRCFYESCDFESCMRNVLSINCDTDTIACISGSIAEAFFKKTGFDNEAILRRYLINSYNNDRFLFDWATKEY